ncbi:hypothetical protein GIB67_007726, partial [Kingdonia uniflora]
MFKSKDASGWFAACHNPWEVIFKGYAKGVQWQSRERQIRLGEGCTCTYNHYQVNHAVLGERWLPAATSTVKLDALLSCVLSVCFYVVFLIVAADLSFFFDVGDEVEDDSTSS